jgi:hypothetical protein
LQGSIQRFHVSHANAQPIEQNQIAGICAVCHREVHCGFQVVFHTLDKRRTKKRFYTHQRDDSGDNLS